MSKPLQAVLWIAFVILMLSIMYWGFNASFTAYDTRGVQFHVYRLSVPARGSSEVLPVFTVRQGDTVTLVVRSDRIAEVHVHGYEERTIALRPEQDAMLTFTVRNAGRFPVHIHDPDGSMYPLGMLEVQPR